MDKGTERRGPRGLGTIRKRPNGAWEVRVTVGGRQRSKCTAPGATKTEAEALRRKMLKEAPKRTAAPSQTTVAQAIEAFLGDAEHRLAHGTCVFYSVRLKHLASRHGTMRIDHLRPTHVRRLLEDLRADLAPRTLRSMHIALSQLERFTKQDFLHGVDAPAVDRRSDGKTRVWTLAETTHFLSTAEQMLNREQMALSVLLIELGPRIGEALGLRWRDVDLEAGTITITRSLDRRTGLEGPTKTTSGRRVVYATPRLRGLLAALSGPPDVRVFDVPLSTFRYQWDRTIKAAGVPRRTLHEARHTCASLRLAAGEPVLAVSKMLGHESIQTTLSLYGHLVGGEGKAGAELMSRLMGGD